MLYCLKKHKKICLPFIIIEYLKHLITKSRTTTAGQGKKLPHYIPFGRILSDILVENGLVDELKDAQCTEDLVTSTGDTLDARNLKNMGVLEEIAVDPVSEDPEEILKKRMTIDGYPIWTKLDSPVALALHIYTLQQEGINTSSFRYEDLPDCPPDMMPKGKKKKRKSEGREPKQKQPKKPKKAKAFGLSTHSESSEKGTSNPPTSRSFISDVDTIPPSTSSQPIQQSPTSSTSQTTQSKQIQTPIFSSSIQTTTPPIVSIPEPIPLNSAPPLKQPQSDSEVTLSDLSPIKSADFRSSDPQSPPSHTLPQTHINPPHTPKSNPFSYDFQGPSTPSEEYLSEPSSPETTNIQSSPPFPVTDPSSAIIIYQPRPLHLLECINFFSETAPKRGLRTFG